MGEADLKFAKCRIDTRFYRQFRRRCSASCRRIASSRLPTVSFAAFAPYVRLVYALRRQFANRGAFLSVTSAPIRPSRQVPRRPICASSRKQSCGQLAEELRAETIDAVSITGGHLGAGLGVVELTTWRCTTSSIRRTTG
jgi:hypothetical protein